MRLHPSFTEAIARARRDLKTHHHEIHTARWQGMDISKRPEAKMHEILNWAFQVPLNGVIDLKHWQRDIAPNLPWADVHFEERVGGYPLNPGAQWKNWPWGNSADKFRTQDGGKFDHTYMERFWPKRAGHPRSSGDPSTPDSNPIAPNLMGVRFEYADLGTLVEHLANDPHSRQAYLPIWFPEDGSISAKRKPCTLGYWFIMRGGYMHMHYPIRSCDIIRHFQDDCYMAIRLMLWILDELKKRDPKTWGEVKPGMYTMWIGSLHCFTNDLRQL